MCFRSVHALPKYIVLVHVIHFIISEIETTRGWTTVLLPIIITVNVALINAGRTVNRIVWESSNPGVSTVNVS